MTHENDEQKETETLSEAAGVCQCDWHLAQERGALGHFTRSAAREIGEVGLELRGEMMAKRVRGRGMGR